MHPIKQIPQRHAYRVSRHHIDVPWKSGMRESHEWEWRFGGEGHEVVGCDRAFEVPKLDLGDIEAEIVGYGEIAEEVYADVGIEDVWA